jgi:heme/copper-type cytochrome/quinol oxidase subunit 4
LWHWVVLTLVPLVLIIIFSTSKDKVFVFIPLSFVLATLSYYFVEQMFRKTRKNKLLLTYLAPALCSILVVVLSFYVFYETNGETDRAVERLYAQANKTVEAEYTYEAALNFSDNNDMADALQAVEDAGYSKNDLCFGAVAVDHQNLCGDVFDSSRLSVDARISANKYTFTASVAFLPSKQCAVMVKDLPVIESNPERAICTVGDISASRYILLLGDSHAEMFSHSLDLIGKRYGYRIVLLAGAGLGSPEGRLAPIGIFPQSKHLKYLEDLQSYALKLEKDATLTIIGLWHRGSHIYDGLIDFVPKFTHKPVVIEDIATIDKVTIASCVNKSIECTFPIDNYYKEKSPLSEVHHDFPDLFNYILTKSRFCNDSTCSAVVGNTIAWEKTGHITKAYSVTLAPYLDRQLRPFLKQ